jgi:NitT/TauT family transport system ATP-binding protein
MSKIQPATNAVAEQTPATGTYQADGYTIDIEHVKYAFAEQTVLQDVTFTVKSGDFLCLLGASGSGKSTLLRLLAGLTLPDSGSININGQPVSEPGLDRGIVFQDYSLFPWMHTLDNIVLALAQAFPGKPKRELQEIAREFLELVGLHDAANKWPGQLSGGMRQRAAIARAFAMNPPILLLDEPFGALDPVTRARLQDLLLDLWQQNAQARKTVLFITHDVEEALLLANRIVVLGLNGSIKYQCSIDLPRPRLRASLFSHEQFIHLRNTLVDILHEDMLSRLDADQVSLPGGDHI